MTEEQPGEELVVVKTSPWTARAVTPEEAAAIEEERKTIPDMSYTDVTTALFSILVASVAIVAPVLVPVVVDLITKKE